jgi:fumarylacetoacetase
MEFSLHHQNTNAQAVAIGNQIIDLSILYELSFFEDKIVSNVFNHDTLNDFIALGKDVWTYVRKVIQELIHKRF